MPYTFKLPKKLRSKPAILEYSEKYDYQEKQREAVILKYAKKARGRGYLTKNEFVQLCTWKSPRVKKHYKNNTQEQIRYVSMAAFSKSCPESLRLGLLTLLDGVSYRMASAILHMCFLDAGHKKGYPIMDVRALGTLGYKRRKVTRYGDYDFWNEYTNFCRKTAVKYAVDLRTLDRALWQYDQMRS